MDRKASGGIAGDGLLYAGGVLSVPTQAQPSTGEFLTTAFYLNPVRRGGEQAFEGGWLQVGSFSQGTRLAAAALYPSRPQQS